jgi:hypothetical protein
MSNIKITKISSKKYEVFVVTEETTHCIYTIKRVDVNRYIVRNMHGDVMVFSSLQEAKEVVRGEVPNGHRVVSDHGKECTNWISYFVKNTKGKKFNSQEDSNAHMSKLAETWKTVGKGVGHGPPSDF